MENNRTNFDLKLGQFGPNEAEADAEAKKWPSLAEATPSLTLGPGAWAATLGVVTPSLTLGPGAASLGVATPSLTLGPGAATPPSHRG